MKTGLIFLVALLLSGLASASDSAPQLYSTVAPVGAHQDFGSCKSGCGFSVSNRSGSDAGVLLGIESAGSLFGATEIGFLSKSAFASAAAGWRAGSFTVRAGYAIGAHDMRITDSVPGFSRESPGADLRMVFVELGRGGFFVRYGEGSVKAGVSFVEQLDDEDAKPERFRRERKDRYSQILIGWRWQFKIL